MIESILAAIAIIVVVIFALWLIHMALVEREPLAILAAFVGGVILLAFMLKSSTDENASWEKYSAEHECRITGKTSGTSSYGMIGGHYGNIYTAGKTTWTCAGGEVFNR